MIEPVAIDTSELTAGTASMLQLYRWDEYQPTHPDLFMGLLLDHHRRRKRPYDRIRLDRGTLEYRFPQAGTDEHPPFIHSVLLTDYGDVYSKVVSDERADPEMAAGHHGKIIRQRIGSLYNRTRAAEEIYGFVSALETDEQDRAINLLRDGPYLTGNDELVARLNAATRLGDEMVDALSRSYPAVTDTEQQTKGRSTEDAFAPYGYGDEMRSIYGNLIDAVAAKIAADRTQP